MPAGVEIEQMTAHRLLGHRTESRGSDAVGRLRAPPHRAGLGIGTGKAVAEKAALAEGCHHALAHSKILDQRSRHEAAEADQAGIEGLRAVWNDMLPYRR